MYHTILLLTLIAFVTPTLDFARRPFSLTIFVPSEGSYLSPLQARAEAKVAILSPANGDIFLSLNTIPYHSRAA